MMVLSSDTLGWIFVILTSAIKNLGSLQRLKI